MVAKWLKQFINSVGDFKKYGLFLFSVHISSIPEGSYGFLYEQLVLTTTQLCRACKTGKEHASTSAP